MVYLNIVQYDEIYEKLEEELSFYTFSIVREPISRFCSLYNFIADRVHEIFQK